MKQHPKSANPVPDQPGKTPVLGKFERTRLKLVSAIRAEIDENGDFGAELVARRSKSSPANFYNHFATKEAALLAAYDQMMAELEVLVANKCQIERLLDEGMQLFMAGWVLELGGFFADNNSLFRLAQGAFGQSKRLRDLFRTHEAAVIESYQRFIELGQAAGHIRLGDPVTLAQMLTVLTESWHHSLVQNLKPGDALHDQLTDALVRILEPENTQRH